MLQHSSSLHTSRNVRASSSSSVCIERPLPHRPPSPAADRQQHQHLRQQPQQQPRELQERLGAPQQALLPVAPPAKHHQQQHAASDSSARRMLGRRRRRRRPLPTGSSSQQARQWTSMHSKVLSALRQQQVPLPQHASVLVAVSGGQDSMAMLRLLQDLSQQGHWPLQLVVGHCDHRVRPDSAANAAHVQRASQALGLPYLQAVADRDQHGHWAEAAARDWRHEQLARMALQAGCGYLALGHTGTERAETVLLNLLRGAGTRGLGAMGWSRQLQQGVTLVRPLLGLTRPETLQACQLTATEVYPDSTNTDPRYVRNQLRLSVFPQLLAINAAAVQHMCSTAEILSLEEELLSSMAATQLAAAVVPCHIVKAAAASNKQLQQGQQQNVSEAAAAGGHVQDSSGCTADTTTMSALSAVSWQLCANGSSSSSSSSSSSKAVHQACLDQVFAQPPQQQQQQQQRRQQQQQQQPEHGVFVTALRLPAVADLHFALQRRVVRMWLSQQAGRSVTARQVVEVLHLMRLGQGSGARTSTLWGSSCVLKHQALLLLLDAATVQLVLSGEARVECVSVDAAALEQTAAACMQHGSTASAPLGVCSQL